MQDRPRKFLAKMMHVGDASERNHVGSAPERSMMVLGVTPGRLRRASLERAMEVPERPQEVSKPHILELWCGAGAI